RRCNDNQVKALSGQAISTATGRRTSSTQPQRNTADVMTAARAVNCHKGLEERRSTGGTFRLRGRSTQSSNQPMANISTAVGSATGAMVCQRSDGMFDSITAMVTPSGDSNGTRAKP